MTPKEFCEFIIDRDIFNKIPSYDAGYAELGRYTWPDRYARLVVLAKSAVLTSVEANGQKPCRNKKCPWTDCCLITKRCVHYKNIVVFKEAKCKSKFQANA